jgi:hypothetical protein
MLRRMLGSDYPGAPEGMLDVLATRTHYLDRRGHVQPLFDPHLIKMLDAFEHDDVLVAQWALFDAAALRAADDDAHPAHRAASARDVRGNDEAAARRRRLCHRGPGIAGPAVDTARTSSPSPSSCEVS